MSPILRSTLFSHRDRKRGKIRHCFLFIELLASLLFFALLLELCFVSLHWMQEIRRKTEREMERILQLRYAHMRLAELFSHLQVEQENVPGYFYSEDSLWFSCYLEEQMCRSVIARLFVREHFLCIEYFDEKNFRRDIFTGESGSVEKLLCQVAHFSLQFDHFLKDACSPPQFALVSLLLEGGESLSFSFPVGRCLMLPIDH